MDREDFNGVVEVTSPDDLHLMETCREVGDALQQAYNNHLWAVAFQGGAVVVRLMSVAGHYGFVLDPKNNYSASALKKHAIMAGGELLERSGQKRGIWDGQFHQYASKD
jgi:hypothetical protein